MNMKLRSNKKEFVGWGCSKTYQLSMEKFLLDLIFLTDNNSFYWGTKINNTDVLKPNEFIQNVKLKAYKIIIFANSYNQIFTELEANNLKYKEDYFLYTDFSEFREVFYISNLSRDYKFLDKIIRNSYRCLDIGANVGIFTLKMARLAGNEGKIFSFEPSPFPFKELKENIKRFRAENVNINHFALVSDPKLKDIVFYIPVDEFGIARFGYGSLKQEFANFWIEDNCDKKDKFINCRVKTKTLDNFCEENNIHKIDFIKIDTEGSEMDVVKGGEKIILKNLPLIQCEMSDDAFGSSVFKKLVDYMLELNFNRYVEINSCLKLVEGYKNYPGLKVNYFIHKQNLKKYNYLF